MTEALLNLFRCKDYQYLTVLFFQPDLGPYAGETINLGKTLSTFSFRM